MSALRNNKPGSAGSNRSKSIAVSGAGAGGVGGASGTGGGADGSGPLSAAEVLCTAYDPPQVPLDIPLVQHAVTGDEAQAYLEAHVTPLLAQGLQALCMIRPPNPVDYLAMYLLRANPNVAREDRGYVEVSANLDDIAPVPQADEP